MTRTAFKFPGARFVPPGTIRLMWYGNGRLALTSEHAEGLSKLSINPADDAALDPQEIAIKDYSENEGVLDALLKAELVQPPHRTIQQGHVRFPVVLPTPRLAEIIRLAKNR